MQQTMPARSRPGLVTAAAIVLIVFGALGTVFGLISLPFSFGYFELGGIFILFAIIGLVGLVFAILALVAGIGLLANTSWARGLGFGVAVAEVIRLVLSIVLTVAFAAQLGGALDDQAQGGGIAAAAGGLAVAIGLIPLAAYGFVAWALNREKAYFEAV